MMQTQPPPAPPPVIVEKGQDAGAFRAFPKIVDGADHLIVMGLNLTGDATLVETARARLAAAGWPADYLTDRSGGKVLNIGAERRTLQEVVELARRLQGKEFGAVETTILTIPDPSFIR